jgi:prolyl-tRNA editing enzyme YbaK/EbsC (Cys-tRNA(Pro) deacylase)
VGGISPFDTRTPLPVYAKSTVFSLEEIYINGGKRGFLVGIDPQDLYKTFSVKKINVAIQYNNVNTNKFV